MAETTQSQNPPRRKPLTVERLREILKYDPWTVSFTWRISDPRGGHRVAGRIAGSINKSRNHGYRVIGVDGHHHRAGTLAWIYVHGRWPGGGEVDHRNRDRADDRLENLREASPSQNQHNSGRQKNNVSGCTGVHSRGAAGWGAEIRIAKQRVWLGTFPTYELAVIARRGAEERLLGEFAPGR